MNALKQDDIIEITIDGLGMDGEGISHPFDYTCFVPFALEGETVRAKVNYVKRNLVFADLTEVLRPSPFREKPPCNRFTRCGGCNLMHMSYEKQLEVKAANVKNLFKKNAELDLPEVKVIPSPKIFAYRNKIQIPFGVVNGQVALGFFKENSHKIVSITKCFLHGEWAERLIGVFLEYAREANVSAYDYDTRRGILRHLTARCIEDTLVITVVTNNADLPKTDLLLAKLNRAFKGTDFSLYLSKKKSHDNVIMGDTLSAIKKGKTEIEVLGLKLDVNPNSFLQLNDGVRDLIYNEVIQDILAQKTDVVIDAYAGVGILGGVLAKQSLKVYNIEVVKEAAVDADRLKEKNNLTFVTNINGLAEEELSKLFSKERFSGRVAVILDPPRKGVDKRVIDALNLLSGRVRVYYISCNCATLTRDISQLTGYKLESVKAYDMFPNTAHIETLTILN